jgi:hypothetical protein
MDFNIDKANVCLVQNANSDMSAPEWDDWKAHINGNHFRFFDNKADNQEADFTTEAGKLKLLNPLGIVVSSDPFFRYKAVEFADAMRNVLTNNIPVCYPFKEFPLYGSNFLLPYGAALSSATSTNPNTAYYKLGQQVGLVLNDQTAANPVPTTPIPSVQWDGASASWQPI